MPLRETIPARPSADSPLRMNSSKTSSPSPKNDIIGQGGPEHLFSEMLDVDPTHHYLGLRTPRLDSFDQTDSRRVVVGHGRDADEVRLVFPQDGIQSLGVDPASQVEQDNFAESDHLPDRVQEREGGLPLGREAVLQGDEGGLRNNALITGREGDSETIMAGTP